VRYEESKRFKNPIVLKIVIASEFWEAEEFHQQYVEKRK